MPNQRFQRVDFYPGRHSLITFDEKLCRELEPVYLFIYFSDTFLKSVSIDREKLVVANIFVLQQCSECHPLETESKCLEIHVVRSH